MRVARTDLNETDIKLVITADASDLIPIKDQVVARLAKNVKIPGFRNGKVPLNLVEKNLDQQLLQSDFLDEALTQFYATATTRENIRPVTKPEVSIKKFVPYTNLEFEVTSSVIGEVKLPDYKKINIKKEAVAISTKDVETVVDSLRTRLAEKKSVDRAAKNGDEVVIDFKGFDKANIPVEGAKGTDYPLIIGSNSFIPGFEEELVGLTKDKNKKFSVVFPKDYQNTALANHKVTFEVTVKDVNELVKPEADDKLAAKVGPFKKLDELKEDIKTQLKAEKDREAIAKQQNEILKAISAKTKVAIPKKLIEEQNQHNYSHARSHVMQSGQSFDDYLKSIGKTDEEYKNSLLPESEEKLKSSLILAEIAKKENIDVTDEELNQQINFMKSQYKDDAMQQELDKEENRQTVAARILNQKVLDLLSSN